MARAKQSTKKNVKTPTKTRGKRSKEVDNSYIEPEIEPSDDESPDTDANETETEPNSDDEKTSTTDTDSSDGQYYSEYSDSDTEQSGGATTDDDDDQDDAVDVQDIDADDAGDVDDVDDDAADDAGDVDDDDVGDTGDAGNDDDIGDLDDEGEIDYNPKSKTCPIKDLNQEITLDEDDAAIYGKLEWSRVPDDERITGQDMTLYEMVRIIGTRVQQLSTGAAPLIEGVEDLHPAKIAYLELISKMTPYIVRRHLPGKKYEEWRIDELKINHPIHDEYFLPQTFDYEKLMAQSEKLNKIYVDSLAD
jgi:DNA-directed RNA polymerase subunit K/omega